MIPIIGLPMNQLTNIQGFVARIKLGRNLHGLTWGCHQS